MAETRLCPTCGDTDLILTPDEPIEGWSELACKSCHRVLEIGRPGIGPLVDPLWTDRTATHPDCPCKPAKCTFPNCTCSLVSKERRTMVDPLKLAELCEKAAEGTRELDLKILRVTSGRHWLWYTRDETVWWNEYGAGAPGNPICSLERFTTSFDDAMSIMPQGSVWTIEERCAWVRLLEQNAPDGVAEHQAFAHTTPLAICAVILRAKAGSRPPVGQPRSPSDA